MRRTAKNAILAKKKADEHHNSVLDYLAIAKTLGPRGIRGQAMKKGLDALDAQLQEICEATGWERVSLDAQYAVYYGRRVAVLCSESEKWVAQFSLRAALSLTLGDRHLIADGADILDSSQSSRLQILGQHSGSQGRLFHNLRHGRPARRSTSRVGARKTDRMERELMMILKDQKVRAKVFGYLHADGHTVPQIAEAFEVTRQTVHKALSSLPDYDELSGCGTTSPKPNRTTTSTRSR